MQGAPHHEQNSIFKDPKALQCGLSLLLTDHPGGIKRWADVEDNFLVKFLKYHMWKLAYFSLTEIQAHHRKWKSKYPLESLLWCCKQQYF